MKKLLSNVSPDRIAQLAVDAVDATRLVDCREDVLLAVCVL